MNRTRPLLLALWAASMAAVAWLSLVPGSNQPPPFPHADKLQHFLAYLWLALLPMLGLATRRTAITCAGAMVFLGAALEVAQAFVPQRTPSLADLIANTLGVVAGIHLATRLKTRQALKHRGLNHLYNPNGTRKPKP